MDNCTIITNSNSIDKNKWSDFVYNHPNGNIFQTPEMYEVYQKTKNYEPIFINIIENNNIVAIMLAVIQKENFGILGALTARSIIWGGPLVKNNNPGILDVILKKYNKIISRKAVYTQFRNFWDWNGCKEIFRQNGFEYEDHLNIIHDLRISVDDMLMNMHKGRRKNIRRAKRKSVEFREIENLNGIEEALTIIKQTYIRVKLPLPDESLFFNVFNFFVKRDIAKFFVAVVRDKIIGARFVFCYKDLVYDWYAGSSNDHSDKYPNDFLPWKVMEWGHNNGYKKFDFGGAGKPEKEYGVRDYKLKFGGKLVNWGRFEKVHNSLLFKIGKIGLELFKRLK